MRLLPQFLWILAFTFAGEVLHAVVPLPVPTAVYGLILLFLALESGLLPLDSVQECGEFLLQLMPVLFVAPAVGLTGSWSILAPVWLPVLAIILVSTILVFGVSGLVTEKLLHLRRGAAGSEQEEDHA